jgi:hypothetical protein
MLCPVLGRILGKWKVLKVVLCDVFVSGDLPALPILLNTYVFTGGRVPRSTRLSEERHRKEYLIGFWQSGRMYCTISY